MQQLFFEITTIQKKELGAPLRVRLSAVCPPCGRSCRFYPSRNRVANQLNLKKTYKIIKKQKKQKMKSLLLFFIASLPLFCFAQAIQKVQPKSGIVLRAQPNKGAEKLLNIPQGTEIELGEKPLATETINGRKGAWRNCTFQGKKGYVFDGFLTDAADPETTTTKATPKPIAADSTLYIVEATSGVVLRAQPNKGAAKLLSIEKGEKVNLATKTAATETIEGKKGAWRACSVQGKKGYIFDGFCKPF